MRNLEQLLAVLNRRGLDFAATNAINEALFQIRGKALENMRQKFTLRNQWTLGSVSVVKATLRTQEGRVGTPRQYLRVQEQGGANKPVAALGAAPMPTPTAAGEAGARRRAKVVLGPNRVKRLRQRLVVPVGANMQQKIKALHDALESHRGLVETDLRNGRALFQVEGDDRHMEVHMLYSLKEREQRVQPKPWLEPAAASVDVGALYVRHLQLQLDRLR